MKRLLLLVMLLPALAAARVPDEEMILDRTLDAESPFYYPALMMRYNAGDTLTDEEYHYLYYGFAYRDEYKPLATNPDLDKMLLLAAGLDPDRPDVATLESLISFGTDALARDPFSPKVLNLMSFAYGALGDKVREKAYADRMNGILRTIIDSGRRIHGEDPAPRADVRPCARRAGRRGALLRQGPHHQPDGRIRAAAGPLRRRRQETQGILLRFRARLLEQARRLYLQT